MKSDQVELSPDNLNTLSGQYNRRAPNDENSDLFWDFTLESPVGDKVILKVLDKRRISVSLLNGPDTLKSKILKGRIEGGEFVFKRRIRIYPLIIMDVVKNGKIRIGITRENNLIVDSRSVLYGHFFFFPIVDGERTSGGYIRESITNANDRGSTPEQTESHRHS